MCAAASVSAAAQEMLYVDVADRGHDINPGMYGIFFEEINHSGDGGMYAELIQNRGFEEQTIPGGFKEIAGGKIQTESFVRYTDLVNNQLTWDWNKSEKSMTGWVTDFTGCVLTRNVKLPPNPLHEATPNALEMVITGSTNFGHARLINTGYWGIHVDEGDKYDLRFYLNTSDYSGKVKASIYDADGKDVIASKEFDVDHNGAWKEYTGELTASRTLSDAKFALEFSGDGVIYVDYVSLFPQKTFMNRPNGLRPDIAQKLVELNPKFMRWPGGCIVEGITLENRVKWKETLGDPMTRPGQYDLWGYRCSWGMGYHEILQFCEDAGMDCMFVGNAGLSCIGWGGEYVSGDKVEPFYQDIKDAIDYAIGDPATNEWAAKRAAAGHPAPFPLKYVEIGNENFGARYDANYKYIYNKLKAEYPQITFLNTMGLEHAVEFDIHTDMIDPHWYVAPEFFYNSGTLFDNVPRGNYDIYVGEYATNVNVGQGNMDAALSEAVFMMNMERNSDIVKMASYAPLIENSNRRNWTCNLIWQRSGEVFGRASYYVQKMFAGNLASYNVKSALHSSRIDVPYNGRMGIGTWETAADFRNLTVKTPEGELLYSSDFTNRRDDWTDMQGTWWTDGNGNFNQSAGNLTRCISLMNKLSFRDCVIEVEARKLSGREGFLLTFGCDDDDWNHYYQLNIGGWSNTGIAFEDVNNGTGAIISERPSFNIVNDRWYKIKVVCRNGKIEGYVDDQLYCSHDFGRGITGRLGAHAGYDEATGEIVLKIVNAEAFPMPLQLNINATDLARTASVETLAANTLWDENSFNTPELIYPVKSTLENVTKDMKVEFAPYSLTVIRMKGKPAATKMTIPDPTYSSEPRELNPESDSKIKKNLVRMIKEAYAVSFSDVEGSDAVRTAADNASSTLAGNDDPTMKAASEMLEGILNTYYKSLMIDANEMTSKLVNPHFTTSGDNSGWSGNPVVNEHVAEIFNAGFNVSQTVSDLENGYYLVYFQGYYRNGAHEEAHTRHADGTEDLNVMFTLNECEKPVVSLMGEVHDGYWWAAPNTMAEAHTVFSQSPDHYANYQIAYVRDGKLTISLNKRTIYTNDWFCFDNVRAFRVNTHATSVDELPEDISSFSPEADVYDMQGRLMGKMAGMNRLNPGIYIVTENGRTSKLVR